MEKKYELLEGDCLRAGERTIYRIRALRDFADVRRGDLGGYIESEKSLSHSGQAWVGDVAQVYGPRGCVRGNGRVSGEAWVLGLVEDEARVCDLVVVGEGAHVGGRTIVCADEIVRGEEKLGPMRSEVSATTAMRVARHTL
jgi:hypothetical protein